MPLGLQIHKNNASVIIKELKNLERFDGNYKIAQVDEDVIIPIKMKFPLVDPFTSGSFVDYEFEERSQIPKSLREALEVYLPDLDSQHYQTSFDEIGSIAIIDLNYELVPFKEIVGKAIMEVNPAIKSVFRKSSKVDGLLRIRDIELIAGVNNTETIHKEHGLRICVDVRRAYFSPRLATEHERIALKIPSNAIVLDLFGSLAPFALHITKRVDATVDTVDINPNAPMLIKKSIALNKLVGSINIHLADATEFTKQIGPMTYDFVIMNHPSNAIAFLHEALRITKSQGKVFYYDFVPIENFQLHIREKLTSYNAIIEDIHIVRQSSPSEYHVCVELNRK